MRNVSRRVEKSIRTRDERLALRWLKGNPPATCAGPGCGKPLPTVLPGSERGRRRTFCSDACRQRSYRARKKNAESTPPVAAPEPMSVASAPAHAMDDCIVAVLEAPHAVAAVLDVVRRALRDGRLDDSEYVEVQRALVALVEEMGAAPDQRG